MGNAIGDMGELEGVWGRERGGFMGSFPDVGAVWAGGAWFGPANVMTEDVRSYAKHPRAVV